MNLKEVRETLYDMAAQFFAGATIIWTEQINTKPPVPYVTLKIGSVQRNTFPIVADDGTRYYQCRTIAEFNIYTKGKPVTVGDNVTGNFVNTATSDMMDFCRFLESDEITDILAGRGLALSLSQPVRDLTDLQNDNRFRYRSMAEVTVSYTEEANGAYGIGGITAFPNSSGGGTIEMANSEIDTIDSIDIT